ncbi:hypothetical protein BJP27_24160 (plasmid) [Pseudomonas oryzihabitans]|nr:hypothetical protein BJP27_24160 [Pseudomonas psychrotolerans]
MSDLAKLVVLFLFVLALSACSSSPSAPQVPKIEIQEAKVPVSTPCIVEAPVRPVYGWGKGDYPGDKAAGGILLIDNERAVQYGKAWEAAAAGCVRGASESGSGVLAP